MKTRIRQIIETLIKQHRPLKLQELSILLEISEKTIHDEISNYWNSQDSTDVIIYSTNNGYAIKTTLDKLEIEDFLLSLDSKYGHELYEHNMLIKLLLNDGFIKLEEIADQFFISVPTAYRVFKSVKHILNEYEIKVISKPGYGIRLQGQEKNKRLCFIHTYTNNLHLDIEELSKQCNMSVENYYLLNYIVQKSLIKYRFFLTDLGLRNLVVHLIYAISRIQQNKYIEKVDDSLVVENRKENDIAKDIISQIEKEFNITFPDSEVSYVGIHLLCKRANTGNEEYFISSSIENLIQKILFEIEYHLGYDFFSDMELFTMLALHFEPMLSRIALGIRMPNPVLEEIKSQFSQAYECAVIASNVVHETFSLHVSDHELGYIALHFNLAIDRLRSSKQLKFLLVCTSGMGTAKFLAKKIETQFQIPKENVMFDSLQHLPLADLTNIDFIVSTVKVPYNLGKRVIYLENILSDIEIESRNKIEYKSFVSRKLVFFELDLHSKEQVIDYLCSKIQNVLGKDSIAVDQVLRREALSGTDIGNYVAIPHPIEMNENKRIFAYCSLRKPIIWNRRKVKFVFLISHSKKDIVVSHKMNEDLFEKVMDTSWIVKLEKIKDYEQFIKLLEE